MGREREDSEVVFLSRNERKRGRRDPDYTGTWQVPGAPDRWASAWLNERRDGSVYLRVIPGREKDGPRDQHPDSTGPSRGDYPMRAGPDARYRDDREARAREASRGDRFEDRGDRRGGHDDRGPPDDRWRDDPGF